MVAKRIDKRLDALMVEQRSQHQKGSCVAAVLLHMGRALDIGAVTFDVEPFDFVEKIADAEITVSCKFNEVFAGLKDSPPVIGKKWQLGPKACESSSIDVVRIVNVKGNQKTKRIYNIFKAHGRKKDLVTRGTSEASKRTKPSL